MKDKSQDTTGLIGTFMIGSGVATGNPALSEFGIIGIILPITMLLATFIITRNREIPFLTGIRWIGAVYIAFIFLWYEQYKLLGDPGSVELFTILTDWLGFHGHERVMRITIGLCEIVASMFILIPSFQGLGAIGAFMLMSGAITFHLVTPLGTDPYHDGGVLFKEAFSVWTTSLVLIWWQRDKIELLALRFGIRFPNYLR